MAAKKSPAEPVAKKGQLNKWEAKFAEASRRAASAEAAAAGTSNKLTVQGSTLYYNDQPVPGNKLRVVIFKFAFENAFYTQAYDADNPVAPACFALADGDEPNAEKSLAPHEKSNDPQSPSCDTCPHNKWGSADVGRGKACKNVRRLLLITEDGLKNIGEATIASLKLSPTNVKNWAAFVVKLDGVVHRPPMAVVTEISVTADKKNQYIMEFKWIRNINSDAELDELEALGTTHVKELLRPYEGSSVPEDEAAQPRKKGAKAGTKGGKPQAKDSDKKPSKFRGQGAAKPQPAPAPRSGRAGAAAVKGSRPASGKRK